MNEEAPDALLARQLSLLLQSRVGIFSLDHRLCYTSFNATHAEAILAAWGVSVCPGMSYLEEIVLNELDRTKARRHLERALAGEDFEVSKPTVATIRGGCSKHATRPAAMITGRSTCAGDCQRRD